MAATIRCFARGALQVAAQNRAEHASENVLIMREPYLAREALTATTGAAVTSASALATSGAKLLQVQIQNGKNVHVRITTTGTAGEADTSDPIYSGENMFQWGSGHWISFLEAS